MGAPTQDKYDELCRVEPNCKAFNEFSDKLDLTIGDFEKMSDEEFLQGLSLLETLVDNNSLLIDSQLLNTYNNLQKVIMPNTTNPDIYFYTQSICEKMVEKYAALN